jgi:hypothetical protein
MFACFVSETTEQRQSYVFWDIMSCRQSEINRRFEETRHLHLLSRLTDYTVLCPTR